MEVTREARLENQGAGGTEGGRRPTGVPPAPATPPAAGVVRPGGVADPEVPQRPVRRRFPAEDKLRILQEADACHEPGQVVALLRREGLYSSHLTAWRRQRDAGALSGLAAKKRGRRPLPDRGLIEENERLRRENQRLTAKLQQAETIIDVQKKLSEMLAIPLPTPEPNEKHA